MDSVLAQPGPGAPADGVAFPSASVVVPAYNARRTIGACLDALLSQVGAPTGYEVIVVDDGSTDGTAAVVAGYAPRVTLLRQERRGPGAARNLGIASAMGDCILFTDADCVPAPDWMARLLDAFGDPEVAGAKGVYHGREGSLVERFVQLEYEDKYERLARRRHIDFIDTYCAAYRREVILAAGGFDPALSVGEDQELSFRLAAAGHRLVFRPDARVRHLGHSATVAAYWRKKLRIGYWKVRVHDRHPGKLVSDSHTPQVMKLQIGLAGLALAALGLAPLSRRLKPVAGLAAGALLLTTAPFSRRAWPKDRAVALVAPALLSLRAVALGAGFALGLAERAGASIARRRSCRPATDAAPEAASRVLDSSGPRHP